MTYKPLWKPFQHQDECNAKMWGKEAFALLMGMRTGKTKCVLDDFGRLELEGKVKNLVVIAPAGVYDTWEDAAAEHLSVDLQKRLRIARWKSGQGVRWTREWEKFLDNDFHRRMMIVNIEAVSRKECRVREDLINFMNQGACMTVIDESTCIKNERAERTDFVLEQLAPISDYRRILSGLPTPRDPLDLYSQFYFLDWHILGHRSFFGFKTRYAITRKIPVVVRGTERNIDIVVGFRDIDQLYGKIEPYSYRKLLKDCYDKPPPVWQRRTIEQSPEQKRMYKEMKVHATTEVEAGVHATATHHIALLTRLHQINCGHIRDESKTLRSIPERRSGSLLELLGDYDGKAVIWCAFDYDIENLTGKLRKEFGEQSVARFWGGNKKEREAEEERFKVDPDCRYLLATPAAGGRGREWSQADLVIYYSYSDNLEHISQSEERTSLVGKDRPVTYVYFVAPGTCDEVFAKSLREKIDLATLVTGDRHQDWLL